MAGDFFFSPCKQRADESTSSLTRYQVDSLVVVTKLKQRRA